MNSISCRCLLRFLNESFQRCIFSNRCHGPAIQRNDDSAQSNGHQFFRKRKLSLTFTIYICCLFSLSPFSLHLQELFTLQLMLQCGNHFFAFSPTPQCHNSHSRSLRRNKQTNKQIQQTMKKGNEKQTSLFLSKQRKQRQCQYIYFL